MQIYDCFMYFDEEIVLETRLNYLDQYVDYFVIIESCYTHRGDKRDLKFNINKFQKFKDKIIYKVYDKIPNTIKKVNDNDDEGTKSTKYIILELAPKAPLGAKNSANDAGQIWRIRKQFRISKNEYKRVKI